MDPIEGRILDGQSVKITVTFKPLVGFFIFYRIKCGHFIVIYTIKLRIIVAFKKVAEYSRRAILTCTDGEFTALRTVTLNARSKCSINIRTISNFRQTVSTLLPGTSARSLYDSSDQCDFVITKSMTAKNSQNKNSYTKFKILLLFKILKWKIKEKIWKI